MKSRVICGLRYLVITLIVLFFLPSVPAYGNDGIGCASARDLGLPINVHELSAAPRGATPQAERVADAIKDLEVSVHKLTAALRGTTQQAERVADAIEAREINVHLLTDESFEEAHRELGGKQSPTAFAHGSAVYLRASSPTLLCDLLHEGVHALDYLEGVPMNRRWKELHAYLRDREFQIAVSAPLQFETAADVFAFVLSNF